MGDERKMVGVQEMNVIEKGMLFTMTYGEYSDYEVLTICRALEDLDIVALKGEYLGLYPIREYKEEEEVGEVDDYGFRKWHFISWLIRERKACEELDFRELFLGAYDEANFVLSLPKGHLVKNG